MKKTTLFLSFFLGSHFLFAQGWTVSGTNIYSSTDTLARVGVGVLSPATKLTVNGGIRLDDAGLFNGLISNVSPYTKPWLSFGLSNSGEGIGSERAAGSSNQYGLDFFTGYGARMCITNAGNVIIGARTQINTTYKLEVNGTIRSMKVVVNTTGADFVFDSTYKLSPLHDVESFIKKNHHLPGIDSAGLMQKNGLDIGDNQTLLLQKVEELTLYLLEIKKENEDLKKRLGELEKTINK